jgi:hypothetical protein
MMLSAAMNSFHELKQLTGNAPNRQGRPHPPRAAKGVSNFLIRSSCQNSPLRRFGTALLTSSTPKLETVKNKHFIG